MTHRASSPRHHVVQSRPCGLGREPDRPICVPLILSDDTAPAPLEHFVDYVYACDKVRSVSWQRQQCLALGLYIDYLSVCAAASSDDATAVLRRFAEALRFGTEDAHGDDPLGLFWKPRRRQLVSRYLNSVNRYTDWVADRIGGTRINPMRPATSAEHRALHIAAGHQKAHAMLGHLHTRRGTTSVRTVSAGGSDVGSGRGRARGFDERQFPAFLFTGFPRRGAKPNASMFARNHLKDIMITLLMHGGGLRESEPFHLFTDDVLPDPHRPGNCMVRLFHPELGRPELVDRMSQPRVSRTAQHGNRERTLRDTYQRQPRTLIRGTQHAGFKNLLLADDVAYYAEVHWFPAFYGELFWQMYVAYLEQRAMPWRHPYLFVSERGGQRGEPYTIGAFQDAHRRAVERMGLIASPTFGTHPHAHRHAYARRAKDAGLDRAVIQVMLHHRDPSSQDIYGTLDGQAISAALADGQRRLDALHAQPSSLETAIAALRNERLAWTGS